MEKAITATFTKKLFELIYTRHEVGCESRR